MNKKILLTTVIVAFLLLMVPNVSAIQNIGLKESIEKNILNMYENKRVTIDSFFKGKHISLFNSYDINKTELFLLDLFLIVYFFMHMQLPLDLFMTHGTFHSRLSWKLFHIFGPFAIAFYVWMIYPTVFKDGFGAENRGTTVILTYFMLKYSAYFIPSYKHFITDRLIGKRVFSLNRSVHMIILAIAMFPFMLKILKSVEPQILISPMNDFVHNP